MAKDLAAPPVKAPDHKLFVVVRTSKDVIVPKVLCEVFLPERSTGPLELRVYPTEIQGPSLWGDFRVSLESEPDQDGVTIRSDRAYWKHGGAYHWPSGVVDNVIMYEPHDLTITHPTPRPGNVSGNFWITENLALKPFKVLVQRYTGEVTIQHNEDIEFDLQGRKLRFEKHYRYKPTEDGGTLTFFEPVAEFEFGTVEDLESTLLDLDDFLLLASFATRQRTICHGWTAETPSGLTRRFRRKFTLPRVKENHSANDFLVSPSQFLRETYDRFVRDPQKDLLRQALWRATSDMEQTQETSFLASFSAVENLLELYAKRTSASRAIVDPERWKAVSKRLQQAIAEIAPPMLTFREASQVRQKFGELNRMSLAAAFGDFAMFNGLRLEPLWPLVSDGSEGATLSTIRNRLVHGYHVGPDAVRALLVAGAHLRWTVEQMLLAVLGWPIEQSTVHPQALETYFPGLDWREERKSLTASWR